jgi:flagellar biosynthesis chaperone FliJ
VPDITASYPWLEEIKEHIKISQNQGGDWLKNICPTVTKAVPDGIISFSSTFEDAASKILGILEQIQKNPRGIPDDSQIQNANSQFAYLVSEIQKISDTVSAVQSQIEGFFNEVVNNRSTLYEDVSTAQAKFEDGLKWVQDLHAVIGDDFLNCQVMGPCNSIVLINMDISFKAQSLGADPSIITLVFIEAILKKQISNQKNVVPAIQNVLDMWTTLLEKTESVITDLKDAQGERYTDILKRIDLGVAKIQWKQLADYVRKLYNSSGSSCGCYNI